MKFTLTINPTPLVFYGKKILKYIFFLCILYNILSYTFFGNLAYLKLRCSIFTVKYAFYNFSISWNNNRFQYQMITLSNVESIDQGLRFQERQLKSMPDMPDIVKQMMKETGASRQYLLEVSQEINSLSVSNFKD